MQSQLAEEVPPIPIRFSERRGEECVSVTHETDGLRVLGQDGTRLGQSCPYE